MLKVFSNKTKYTLHDMQCMLNLTYENGAVPNIRRYKMTTAQKIEKNAPSKALRKIRAMAECRDMHNEPGVGVTFTFKDRSSLFFPA